MFCQPKILTHLLQHCFTIHLVTDFKFFAFDFPTNWNDVIDLFLQNKPWLSNSGRGINIEKEGSIQAFLSIWKRRNDAKIREKSCKTRIPYIRINYKVLVGAKTLEETQSPVLLNFIARYFFTTR